MYIYKKNLIFSYEHGLEQTKTKAVTSTPMHGQTSKPGFAGTQVISDISAESGNTAPDMYVIVIIDTTVLLANFYI